MVVEVQRSPDLPNDGSPRSATEGGADVTVNTVAAVSPDDLGMQHKLSDSWKNAYNTEYPAMAEDGTDATTKTLPNGITSNSNNNSSAGSIVNSLLKKVGGFGDGVSITNGGGSGLEQKIQELRAEKEAAGEMKKCPSSLHNDQDSPLDFSVKRRSSFSGSLTDESQASSSSPGHVTDYNAVSPGADQGPFSHSDDFARRGTPSPDRLDDHNNGSLSNLAAPPVTSMPALMNGMGVFPGLPSNLMGNGSAINAFSQMAAAAAFMDPRNKKNNNRPFKAYPKEVLQMPLGLFGIPGLTPTAIQQGMDSGVFAGMNNDDLVSLYNQQLQVLRDKHLSAAGGKISPPSQVPTPNGNHSQHQQQHHLHHNHQKPQQQQQHHPNHRLSSPSPMPHTPTANSMSPSHVTPDHVIPSTTPTPTFPAPGTPASMNSTLVSSTSNSRKRPRSLPDEMKDAAYWERRRKNNDAAKRSRDARRAKEDEIAIRAALLEQENLKLRVEVAALKTETARLRCLLYNS